MSHEKREAPVPKGMGAFIWKVYLTFSAHPCRMVMESVLSISNAGGMKMKRLLLAFLALALLLGAALGELYLFCVNLENMH